MGIGNWNWVSLFRRRYELVVNDTHTFIMMMTMTMGNKTVAVFAFADSNLMILVAVADELVADVVGAVVLSESVGRALHYWWQ